MRDRTATARDELASNALNGDDESLSRLYAARDRAAAALDRYEAALDRCRAAQHLREIYRDQLTGVLQRDAGHDQLQKELDRCRRRGDPMVIAFVDVDGLKQTNDAHGHVAGDQLLRHVADALESGLRSYDVIVRYGGDEFVCGLADTRLEHAELRVEQVRKALGTAAPGASISVGLAELGSGELLDAGINRADQDLYRRRRDRTRTSTSRPL